MIGDIIDIREEYLLLAKKIIRAISNEFGKSKIVIAVGGESGSGKSVTAIALSRILAQKNISSIILHQDDYFFFPPKTNDLRRRENIANVGVQEVNLEKLSQNIFQFKNNQKKITKPLVNYNENNITEEIVMIDEAQVLLVEGTYVLSIPNLDYKIFIERTYKDTFEQRKNRNRDVIDEFSERVLEIEHKIIKKYHTLAHGIIDKQYQFHLVP